MSEPGPTPRADLFWALAWIAVGAAMFAGGFTMDRLERQHINPYTAPGLVPALLGIGIAVLGAILLVRSVRRGALAAADGGSSSCGSTSRSAPSRKLSCSPRSVGAAGSAKNAGRITGRPVREASSNSV